MKYYKISNSDGKEWLMPNKNIATGLLLYQPIAWRGKLLKTWFPVVNMIDVAGIVKRCLHIEEISNPISEKLRSLLCEIFKSSNLEFSIFNGTPCAHQKVTIQIYQGRNIWGYCKVSKNPELIEIFQREKAYLDWLNERKVNNVPKCLCCKKVDDDTWMFVQTTTKTSRSRFPHTLGDLELNFLKQLSEKTKCVVPFSQTEMFKSLNMLEEMGGLGNKDVIRAFEIVRDYYGHRREEVFSAYHSDFTPWNMFVETGNLFVFDWEYAGRTYLPYLDIIHYIVQTNIFENKSDAKDLYDSLFVRNKRVLETYFSSPNIAVLSYLLDIIAKYSLRDKDHETPDTIMLQQKRVRLIHLVLQNI